MDSERWQQIEQLYHAALELRPAERSAFLDQACAGDADLKAEVESLLTSIDKAGSFIETPPSEKLAEAIAEEKTRSMIGLTLGHYQIQALIGAGGMGEVYRAHDTRLHRNVAVKILPENLASDIEARHRFEREAKAVASLSHPNILSIFDYGSEQGYTYAVTELLDGQTLRDRLVRARLDWKESTLIGISIADGLASAHSKGIIHRDLKPENIFLTSDGLVKILDFGIARIITETTPDCEAVTATYQTTKRGTIMGTVGYMSPEQVRGEPVEAPSDIFALGCMLYEMVSGNRPFTGETAAETMASILRDESPELHNSGINIPDCFENLIRHCLQKKKGDRFQSALELSNELRSIPGSETPTLRKTSNQIKSKVHPGILIGAAALILLGVFTAFFYIFQKQKDVLESIAVLPLANSGRDENVEYLTDGLTEAIINHLSQLPQLKRVIARSTMATYKGKQVDPRKLGQELKVRAVLTGSLIQRGDDLIVNAELVNTFDGSRLWGRQFIRKSGDVITLQNEIARQVSENLKLELTGEQQQRLSKLPTDSPEAYKLYLTGRHILATKWSEEDFKKAIESFQRAIDIDPTFAMAWAGLAEAYYSISNLYLPPHQAMPKSRAAAERALSLDPTLAEAYHSLGVVKSFYYWEWDGADQAFNRALQLNPGFAPAHPIYGLSLMVRGRTDEARAEINRLMELDPLSLSIANCYANTFIYTLPSERQLDRTLDELKKLLVLDPNFTPAHTLLNLVYMKKGLVNEAFSELDKAIKLDNGGYLLGFKGWNYAVAGKRTDALKIIDQIHERSKNENIPATSTAMIYAGLGENDAAFAWLQKCIERRDEDVTYIMVDPKFDNLRSDHRFNMLLKEMKLLP